MYVIYPHVRYIPLRDILTKTFRFSNKIQNRIIELNRSKPKPINTPLITTWVCDILSPLQTIKRELNLVPNFFKEKEKNQIQIF